MTDPTHLHPSNLQIGDGQQAANGDGPAPDPFDPATLRLSQDFSSEAGVRKALVCVPVRKPDKGWFVRAHPDRTNYWLETAVIEMKEDREMYLVARDLWPELSSEATFKPKLLVTSINRQGVLFLWELALPRPDGRRDEWASTALEAVELATKRWVRVTANMSLGAYDIVEAGARLPDPEWPKTKLADLLRVGFRDRFISDLEHPLLRRLRGEV